MPRQRRIEYSGAQYHIINRGNYRSDLFTVHKTGEAFEQSLFEAAERCGWIIHAYCIMSNHYHLCIETPKGNLSVGMQWLQSVFSNRFNKFVGSRGHVFQGRYKALLVEREESLVDLVNYIHLNPVRAKLVTLASLQDHALSSFPKFFKKKHRPEMLVNESWLHDAVGWTDSPAGMKAYHKYLNGVVDKDKRNKVDLSNKFERGWCLGSKSFKQGILEGLRAERLHDMDGAKKMSELNKDNWLDLLSKCINRLGKSNEEIKTTAKNSDWKCAIGLYMKTHSSVSNRFLTDHLNMGTIQTTSANIEKYRKTNYARTKLWKTIRN